MSDIEELAFDVEFMCCEVDRADNLRVVSADGHFADFIGADPAEIDKKKIYLYDIIDKKERENVIAQLRRKGAPYVYFDFCLRNKNNKVVLVHCCAQNISKSKVSRITIADVSRSERKTQKLQMRADALRNLIDEVNVGICIFKVNKDMHFEALNINKACCSFFGTQRELLVDKAFRIDDLIHPDDKSEVFQAIGKSMATKMPIDMTMRVITHKNSFMNCKFSAAILRNDEDGCPVFHATLTDITDLLHN